MTQEHKELLTKYLKGKAISKKGWPHENILFFDTIDHKRVDLSCWWEALDNNIYIAGDQAEIYTFDELDLIDKNVLNTAQFMFPEDIPQDSAQEPDNTNPLQDRLISLGLEYRALGTILSYLGHTLNKETTITEDHELYSPLDCCYNTPSLNTLLNSHGITILRLKSYDLSKSHEYLLIA